MLTRRKKKHHGRLRYSVTDIYIFLPSILMYASGASELCKQHWDLLGVAVYAYVSKSYTHY